MTEDLTALLAAADDEIDAFAVFTAVADDAVLVSPSGERWFREDPRSTSSAAGSYAAEWAMNAFFREPGVAFLYGRVDGEQVAFRVESDAEHGGCHVEHVNPAGIPELADGLAGGSRWARALDELAPLGFTPRYAPITLAQLADFCVDSSHTDAVRRTARVARSRSGSPFTSSRHSPRATRWPRPTPPTPSAHCARNSRPAVSSSPNAGAGSSRSTWRTRRRSCPTPARPAG